MSHRWTCAALCLLVALVGSCQAERAGEAAEITLVYTGNANGILVACGCPGNPYGGFVPGCRTALLAAESTSC
jgi:hypothetical protein